MNVELLTLYTLSTDGTSYERFLVGGSPVELLEYSYTSERMGGTSLTATVRHAECLDTLWTGREFVVLDEGVLRESGVSAVEKFFLSHRPSSSKSNEDDRYVHTLEFRAGRDILLGGVYFCDAVSAGAASAGKYVGNSYEVKFIGTLDEFVQRFNDVLAYRGLSSRFSVSLEAGVVVTTESKEIGFDKATLADALEQAVATWGVPFYFLGDTAVFGSADGVPLVSVEYGVDEELLSVSMNNRGEKIVTRIAGAGGTENVPYYYPNPSPKGTLGVGGTATGVTISDMVKFSQLVGEGDTLVYTGKDADFGGVALHFGGFTAASAAGSPTAVVDGEDHYGVDAGTPSMPFDAEVQADLSGGFDRSLDVLITALLGSAEGISPDTELYYLKKMNFPVTADDYVKRIRGDVSAKGWTPFVERVELTAGSTTIQLDGYECLYADMEYGEEDAGLYPERKLLGVRIDLGAALPLLPAGTSLSSCKVRVVGSIRSAVTWWVPDGSSWHYAAFHVASLSVTGEFDPCGWYNGDQPIGQDLSVVGLSQSGTPVVGSTITQTVVSYVTPTGRLMPSIYRTSGGAERAYEAEDGTYINPETGDYYTFENEYDALQPHEHIEDFDDVYPSINNLQDGQGNPLNVLQEVWFDDGFNVRDLQPDGQTLRYQWFFVKLKPLGFNLFDCATENGDMAVVMSGGACAGCHFKILVTSDGRNPVQKNNNGTLKKEGASGHQKGVLDAGNIQPGQQDTTSNAVWIALYLDDSTFGGGEYGTMPAYDKTSNAGPKPVSGDAFVLENIMLPQAFFTAAEQELDRRLIRFMWENNADKFDPSVVFSRIWLAQHPLIRAGLSERSRLSLTYDGRVFSPLYVSRYTLNVKEGEPLPEILLETADIVQARTSGIDEKISAAVDAAVNVVVGAAGGADLGETDKRYLRKDMPDTAPELVTFEKGFEVGRYRAGLAGIGGSIYTNEAGEAIAEVDFLNVRRKATFTQVEVESIRKVNGTILLSLADITVTAVEKVSGGWKCSFKTAASDGTAIVNAFAAGDQAICRKLQSNDDHYYWRLVTAVGADYITLSDSDADSGSDEPRVGDVVVQLGNRTAAGRQAAQILSCYGANSPSYVIYAGISGYSLSDKDISGFEYRETSAGSGVYRPYFFNYGPMLLGDRNKTQEYMEFTGSALNIKGRMTVLNSQGAYVAMTDYMAGVAQQFQEQQAQIDGQTQSWASGEATTAQTKPYPLWDETTQQIIGTPNYPYTEWEDDTERAKHVGDTYVDDTTGQSYRFTKKTQNSTTVYYWTRITDEEVSQALALAEGVQYLKDATNEGTLVDGGLVLTSMIQLGYTPQGGSYTVMSGINGKPNEQLQDPTKSIAAWFGGPMVDHETYPSVLDYAKSLFRMDGSGYLAGGNIGWQADGDGHIPGISWETVGGVTNVTIGANVKLAQTGGTDSSVTDLVSAVQGFPNNYVSIATPQTITGKKTFSHADGITIGGATLKWHPESSAGAGDGYLEIDSALLTLGDQIVGSGTPGGGGGGGASYLYQLNDTISTWTAKPSVSATQVLVFDPSAQDKESSTGAWKYVPATDIGRVYSGGTGITIDQNTNEISVTANTYLPLTGGTLTGGLNIKNDTGFLRFLNSSGTTKMEVAYYPSYGAYIYNAAVSGGRILGIKDDGTPYYNDGTAFRTLYHSGNFSVTLNGTATTSASFYAPTSAGDTAGQVCVWSSGAPAWTSATKGSATQPIYLSGGVLTAGTALGTMAYASTGDYLPLTAGSGKMLTDDLWIKKTSGTPGFRVQINSTTVGGLEFDSSNTVTLYSQGSNFPQLKLKSGVAYPVFRYNSVENTVYHSGNSNSTSVAWSASSLTLGNALYLQNNYDIYWKDSGGTYRSMAFLSAGNSFVLGSGLTSAPSGGYLILRGAEMRFQTCALGGTLADSMWINSSGNVTVGTSDLASTSYKLYVNGATYINGAISGATTISASNGIVAGGDTSGVYFGSAKGGLGSSYTGGLAYVYGNNPLYFYTASAQRMIITGGGNVGIGTDSPDTRLHTVGAANAWTTHFQGSGSVMQVHMCYPNIGAIITSSRNESTDTLLNVRNTVSSTVTSVLYVRGDGNVGIGTTSPWKNLDVIGELYAGSSTAGVVVGRSGAKIDGFTYNSWGTSLSINSLSSGNVIIATGGGNVGVGTSSPGYKCEIVTTEDTAFALKRTASGGVFMDVYPNNQTTNKWRIGSSPTSTDYVFRLLFNSNTRLELSSSGTLTTTGDQVISSDITLKKNIKDLDLTVEQIAQLPAVTFDWKDGRGSTFGTVAQGVLPIFPQAVRGNEGNYSVVYGQGGWVFGVKNARAIVDIQAHETEQDKEIKKLKDKVAKQNAEILRLKARLNMN